MRGIGPYIFYRRFSDFHTPQVQSKALVDGGAGEPFERFPGRLFPFLIGTERRPSTAVGFREGRRRLRIWSFRRPGGSAMQLASSDAAAVLFFLKKRKKRMGAQKRGRAMPAPTASILARWKIESQQSLRHGCTVPPPFTQGRHPLRRGRKRAAPSGPPFRTGSSGYFPAGRRRRLRP